jgi:hypothetical protein
LAIQLGQKADRCDKATQLEVERAIRLGAVDLNEEKMLHQIDNDAAKLREDLLKRQVEALRPSWYERPVVVAVIAVVATVGAVYLTAKVLEAVH